MPGTREVPDTGDRIIVWLGDRVELDLEPERPGDLHDRRETGVAVGRERLVETLAAHPDLAGKLAEILRAGDVAECLSHERRVIARLLEDGFEVVADVLERVQVVRRVVGLELSLCHCSPTPSRSRVPSS